MPHDQIRVHRRSGLELLRDGYESADQAWRIAAGQMFAGAPKARDKVCPREAFLGLCAAGLLSGVTAGACPESRDSPNRNYAITAVRLLSADPDLARRSKIGLWRRVMTELGLNTDKKHNEQLGVVLALWEQGLIVAPATSGRVPARVSMANSDGLKSLTTGSAAWRGETGNGACVMEAEELAVHFAMGMVALRKTAKREERREPGHRRSIWMAFHRQSDDEQSHLTVAGNDGLTLEAVAFPGESIETMDAEKSKVIRALQANGAEALQR